MARTYLPTLMGTAALVALPALTLAQTSGLAMVYMQFRDAAGNESPIIPNSILVGTAPPLENPLYAPLIANP